MLQQTRTHGPVRGLLVLEHGSVPKEVRHANGPWSNFKLENNVVNCIT